MRASRGRRAAHAGLAPHRTGAKAAAHARRCIPFFRAAVYASRDALGAGGPWPPGGRSSGGFRRGRASDRLLCCPASETTKGLIYYCVRVVYAWEEYAPNAVPPAFLCATYNSGRCSVFLHITVYNMHIVLEACSPSASVSGVWVYLRRKKKSMHLSFVCVSCISQQQLAFCLKKAKMLKSKQSCFSFCPLCKCVTKMLITTV